MRLRRRGLAPLAFTIVLVVGLLGYTFAAGNSPFLGLDLQGGVAVILSPSGPAEDEQLEDAVAIIRNRVDAIGVAEPEITRQGQNISVEIPGVTDRQQALDLVGQTGELAFRPVLDIVQTGFPVDANGEFQVDEESLGDVTIDDFEVIEGGDGEGQPEGQPEAEVEPEADADGGSPGGNDAGGTDEGSLSPFGIPAGGTGELALGLQEPEVPEVPEVPVDELPAEILEQLEGSGGIEAITGEAGPDGEAPAAETPAIPDITVDPSLDDVVVQPQYVVEDGQRFEIGRYRLGPASLTGAGLESASASIDERGQWVVRPVFRPGADGIDAFNVTASACFAADATCPTGQFAITLDNEVISSLGVQAPTFGRDQIVISGGFDEQSAKELSTVLRYGALPVELEIQSVQEVSATLGRDALRAGVIAGLVGLGLVALFMLLSYRLLGITAVAKLAIEAGLLWSIIAWLGSTQGLALTLAGVTGIVVSIGLSVDSNVVYFETIKEDIRNGRSLRSAADRSFAAAWRTIVKADLASLIAAVLLYALAVGPVRGFAFYLGLATVLDLFVAWFFMRPAAALSLRSSVASRRPRLFGLPAPGVQGTASGPQADLVKVQVGAARAGGADGGGPVDDPDGAGSDREVS